MNKIFYLFGVCLAVLLAGCGATPQPKIDLSDAFVNNTEQKVGVYIEYDKATTHIYGASCLLCYGVAAAANSSLTSHLEEVPTDDVAKFGQLVVDKLSAQGKQAKIVNLPKKISKLSKFKGELGYPKRDFRNLKKNLDVDTLIVIEIQEHGAHRFYNAYVPTSDPIGSVTGYVYTVDLETNKYLQYERLNYRVNVPGEWDEPPSFPGVTESYFEAVEKAKEHIQVIF